MKPIVVLTFISILFILSCNTSSQEPPIVDGFNSEFNLLKSSKFQVSEDILLQLYQNEHFVWLTYNVPKGSYGTMDMVLETPNLSEAINLHVSAQVGEWYENKPDSAPKTPESDKWGLTKGWTGNAIWFKQMDTSADEPQLVFKSAPARELQLSKSYFGKGNWLFNIEIRAIKDANGNFKTLKFPKDSEKFELEVY